MDASGGSGGAEPAEKVVTLNECVQLLRAKNKEKKLVGLLLVTKLLPTREDADLEVKEVQVEHISLTPRVESARVSTP